MNDNDIATAYLDSLLEELDAAGLVPDPIRPVGFGITVLEYMAKTSCTEGVARTKLQMAVKKGLLVVHTMNCGPGAGSLVYCRPGEWQPE